MEFWQILGALWPVVAFLLVVIGGAVAWAFRAEGRSKSNEVLAREAKETATKANDDLSLFRERVAQEYATQNMVGLVRADISQLSSRIDRVLEMGHRA
jgi:cbb3-type cytochrome oxidase subunit 3